MNEIKYLILFLSLIWKIESNANCVTECDKNNLNSIFTIFGDSSVNICDEQSQLTSVIIKKTLTNFGHDLKAPCTEDSIKAYIDCICKDKIFIKTQMNSQSCISNSTFDLKTCQYSFTSKQNIKDKYMGCIKTFLGTSLENKHLYDYFWYMWDYKKVKDYNSNYKLLETMFCRMDNYFRLYFPVSDLEATSQYYSLTKKIITLPYSTIVGQQFYCMIQLGFYRQISIKKKIIESDQCQELIKQSSDIAKTVQDFKFSSSIDNHKERFDISYVEDHEKIKILSNDIENLYPKYKNIGTILNIPILAFSIYNYIRYIRNAGDHFLYNISDDESNYGKIKPIFILHHSIIHDEAAIKNSIKNLIKSISEKESKDLTEILKSVLEENKNEILGRQKQKADFNKIILASCSAAFIVFIIITIIIYISFARKKMWNQLYQINMPIK